MPIALRGTADSQLADDLHEVVHPDRGEDIGLSAPAKRHCASENIMKKRTERRKLTDELRREYDLSKLKGVRGKYATRYQAGTNLVLLAPDVAEYFRDEQSVNTALRKLIQFCANSLAKRRRVTGTTHRGLSPQY